MKSEIEFSDITEVYEYTEKPESTKSSLSKSTRILLLEQLFNDYLIEKYGDSFTKDREYKTYFQNEIVFDFLKQLLEARFYFVGTGRIGFYNSIANDLYTYNWKIGETDFSDPFRFLEAKHLKAEFKDKEYYENIIKALSEHFGFYVSVDFYKKLKSYCEGKILSANYPSQKIENLIPVKKFYLESDYEKLVNDLLDLPLFSIESFLESHASNTNETLLNWIIRLRKYIMIDLGLNQNQDGNPEQINFVYHWMESKQRELVKELNKRANFQFNKPVKDWTVEEFEANKKEILQGKSNPFNDTILENLVNVFEIKQSEYLEYHNNKVLTESFYDPNKPLKNYDEMFWKHETYLKNIAWNFEKLKHLNEITREFEGIDKIHGMYIGSIIHRAKQEIKQLVFTPNNNSERFIVATKTRIKSITDLIIEIEKENKLNHCDILPKYRFFLDAVQPFWEFSDWFKSEILGESLGEVESPVIENSKSILNETPQRLIVFTDKATIEELTNILSFYFPERKQDLEKALAGEKLIQPLLFPNNQNKLVELFRRVKYNSKILSSNADIKDWICSNFEYLNKKKVKTPLNPESVRDILDKGKTIPPIEERIATDIFQFKSHKSLMDMKNKE